VTYREEVIEEAAKALAAPYLSAVRHPAGVAREPWRVLIPAAEAAFDAILAKLKEPSEEMLAAGVIGLNNSGIDDVEDRDASWCIKAALTTLEKTHDPK
jgi:hypothetical protein